MRYYDHNGDQVTEADVWEPPTCDKCGETLGSEDNRFSAHDLAGDLRTYGDIDEFCTNPECPECADYEPEEDDE